MDFEQSKQIGDRGELAVRSVLHEQQRRDPSCGFISDLLLWSGRVTSQIDHVLVDRHGILIIEVKTWNEGYLRGTADEKRWTVVYGFSQSHAHHNPLHQLATQRDALRKALRAVGEPLDPDDLQSIVVFAGGTITDKLELSAEDRAKVTTIFRLPDLLRARQTPRSSGNEWDSLTIRRRYEQLQSLNRASDPQAQAAHSKYRQRFRGRAQTPSADTARFPVTVSRPVPRPARSSYAGRQFSRSSSSAPIVLVLTGLVLMMFACVVPNLMKVAIENFTRGLATHTAPAPSVPSPTPSRVPASVDTAKSALRQIAPDVYDTAVHLDQPATVDAADGSRTFTWEYVTRQGRQTAVIKKFSLTLRPDGSIAGMAAAD